jgi:aromatic-L-amino-acid/L-tryptophan decarboxylase
MSQPPSLEELRARVRDVSLELPPDEMRRLGYAMIDLLVERASRLDGEPAIVLRERRAMEDLFREPLPEAGIGADAVLRDARERVLSNVGHVDHPRFFGYIPGSTNFVSVLGDALASGFNVFGANWLAAPGPIEVEIVVLDWFRDLLGMPASAGGILVSGGSMSLFTALAVARHAKLGDDLSGAVLYLSDQAHSSVARAAKLLGLGPKQLRFMRTGADFRMDASELRRVLDADLRGGLRPLAVVANAGTTNTGSIDPLAEIADACAERGVWFHADAAYGGFAALTERGRRWLAGIERADSVTLDPHKWLFQPFEAGCVLVRDRALLRKTFTMRAEYLQDAPPEEEKLCFFDYGPQLSRSCRALKIWMSLRAYGAARFREIVDQNLDLARLAEAWLAQGTAFEILSPARLGIVCFRFAPPELRADAPRLDAVNEAIVRRTHEEGFAMITSTRLGGRFALRLCVLNHRTRRRDVEDTLAYLERIGREIAAAS